MSGVGSLVLLYGAGIVVTVICSAITAFAVDRGVGNATLARAESTSKKLFVGYLVFYVVFMTCLGMLRMRAFHTYADLATHLEILWRSKQGLGLTSPMSADYWKGSHWFAAHFTPVAYLTTVPLFSLVPSFETLVVFQTLALAIAVVPIVLYARDRLGTSGMFLVGLGFLAYPTLQYTNLYDFEYLRLSIPCLAWAFYALTRRWRVTYWVMTILALMAREEVGLVVAAVGVYAWFVRRDRVTGVLTAILGSSYFAIAVFVVIPSFREGGGLLYQHWFSESGEQALGTAVLAILRRIASMGYDPIRLGNLVMLLLPFQFLSLGGMPILLVTLPNVLSTFASQSVSHYAFFLYYLSPSVPFIAYSAIDGAAKLRDWLARHAAMQATSARHTRERRATLASATLLASGAFFSNVFFGPSPLSLQFWNRGYRVGEFYTTNFHVSNYLVTEHARVATKIVEAVPRDAAVSAEQFFLPHLYDRRRMFVFPVVGDDVEYVLIDRKSPLKTGWDTTYLDFRERPEHYYGLIEHNRDRWKLLREADGVRLFVRRYPIRNLLN